MKQPIIRTKMRHLSFFNSLTSCIICSEKGQITILRLPGAVPLNYIELPCSVGYSTVEKTKAARCGGGARVLRFGCYMLPEFLYCCGCSKVEKSKAHLITHELFEKIHIS